LGGTLKLGKWNVEEVRLWARVEESGKDERAN